MEAYIEIKNMPETFKQNIVCRIVDGEFWYWGSWDNDEDADRAAKEINGIVAKVRNI